MDAGHRAVGCRWHHGACRGWAYASGARPKGGIVIGGDNKVPFGGLIDEVRVWNRRLSDEELDA